MNTEPTERCAFDRDRPLADLLDPAKAARWTRRVGRSLGFGAAVVARDGELVAVHLPHGEPTAPTALCRALQDLPDPEERPGETVIAVGRDLWHTASLLVGGDPCGWLALGPRREGLCDPGDPSAPLHRVRAGTLRALLPVLRDTLEWVLASEQTRAMTSDLHLEVVEVGHREMLETNRRLQESEAQLHSVVQDLTRGIQEAAEQTLCAQREAFRAERQFGLGRLAAGVAHEINNPMAFVTSNLGSAREYLEELVAAGASPPDGLVEDFRDLLDEALSGAHRVRRIVEDLKTFSRVDAAAHGEIDLVESVRTAARLLAGRTPPGVGVEVVADRPVPLHCDAGSVHQALFNLLENAVQAVAQGGSRVTVRCRKEAGHAWIEVEDDGPGIEDEIVPLLFDPFFTTREVGQGCGLGLTVVADVARAHGGGVEVDPDRPRGALFRLRLRDTRA